MKPIRGGCALVLQRPFSRVLRSDAVSTSTVLRLDFGNDTRRRVHNERFQISEHMPVALTLM